jgi:dihydrofolate reductase
MMLLLYSAAMSMDGFIAGPGGDMPWLTPHLGRPDEAAAPGATSMWFRVVR